ncbi:hypothetical protein M9H77_21486 [Catharanthus roseus]|uniref:Uncharacterized protein n=1 Tax=Catharanthus roseus TaxID=4058 RepID=A0ACC0AQE2_CATRO|nr:hypothetical protein M9H77_21486 [Catharanthus roseus]
MKTSFRPGLKFVENQVNGHVSGLHCTVLFYCGAYNLVPRGTQMPYSAAVDLVAGLGASQMAHPYDKWTYREGTLVDEPSRTTSSSSSSYSLREIIPEREPIPVIDLSDDEEYDICGYCLWREQRAEAASQQVVELREEISRMDALFYAARQARRQETARAAILERELYWNFLVFRNMLGSQSPNHADEVMLESSQNRQSEPMREATPRPEQATHKLNDIYDTLKYEDALRVTIGGLELSKHGHLRTNHGPGTIFMKNSKRNTYLVGFVSNERMSFSN